MEIQVETYEVTELDSATLAPECDAEAIALIETLGLEGQQGLIAKDDDGEKVRVPYRLMSAEEWMVFHTLFPVKSSVKEYDAGPIPLRILQVIAHANELFDHVFIMHPRDARDPDPVLCGTNVQYDLTLPDHHEEIFLLARWGEALESVENLLAKTVIKVRENLIDSLKKIQRYAADHLDTVENMSDSGIAEIGDGRPSYYFHAL